MRLLTVTMERSLALLGALSTRQPVVRRAASYAPYGLLAAGGGLCGLTYPGQGDGLLVSGLLLVAGLSWCLERHGY